MKKTVREQADFDQAQYHASDLHGFDKQEFSDRGRGDIKVRPNDPRFSDNPMASGKELLDEYETGQSEVDSLHQMLNKAGISDQQIRGDIQLARSGKMKVAARLGIGPDDVDTYLHTLVQQLRDEDSDAEEQDLALAEQYYNAVNVIDEDGEDEQEAGQPDRPFALDEDNYKRSGYEVTGKPGRYFWIKRNKNSDTFHDEIMHGTAKTEREAWNDLRKSNRHMDEARYSYEPDALGSITVRDSATGRSSFVQGAAASRLLSQLKNQGGNQDALLAPLVEALDEAPGQDFDDEIKADAGTYNFLWKIGSQHGSGTVMFHADGGPHLKLTDVRNSNGDEIDADPTMRHELLRQASDFLGRE